MQRRQVFPFIGTSRRPVWLKHLGIKQNQWLTIKAQFFHRAWCQAISGIENKCETAVLVPYNSCVPFKSIFFCMGLTHAFTSQTDRPTTSLWGTTAGKTAARHESHSPLSTFGGSAASLSRLLGRWLSELHRMIGYSFRRSSPGASQEHACQTITHRTTNCFKHSFTHTQNWTFIDAQTQTGCNYEANYKMQQGAHLFLCYILLRKLSHR